MEIKNDQSVGIPSKSPDVNLEIQYDVNVVRYRYEPALQWEERPTGGRLHNEGSGRGERLACEE